MLDRLDNIIYMLLVATVKIGDFHMPRTHSVRRPQNFVNKILRVEGKPSKTKFSRSQNHGF
jgi:hypothetical protein